MCLKCFRQRRRRPCAPCLGRPPARVHAAAEGVAGAAENEAEGACTRRGRDGTARGAPWPTPPKRRRRHELGRSRARQPTTSSA
eukprot:1255584-Pyramimonas_sp.AAC.1